VRTVRIGPIGELALRVSDLATMKAFYTEVLGFEVFADEDPSFCFLKVADATEGHPHLLVLFDRGVEVEQRTSTLDHFAFLIELKDYEEHRERLTGLGVDVFPKTFPRFGWRSLFFSDPEGNRVELVCHDPSVGTGDAP
jgi:catechol-2,3-dioxygenase